MRFFFDPVTTAFFRSDIHGCPDDEGTTTPAGVNEVDLQLYEKMAAVRANGGRVIADARGMPVSAPPVVLTEAELAARERVWRDAEMQTSDGVVTRHRDQLDVGSQTTLTDTQYGALQEYRARLRDWPAQKDFPDQSHRPVAPS